MQPLSRGFKTPLRKKLSNSISAVSTLPGLPPRGIPKILGMERTLRGWIKSTNINCYLRLQVECRQTWTCNMCERLHEIKDGKLGRPPIIKDFSKVFLHKGLLRYSCRWCWSNNSVDNRGKDDVANKNHDSLL